MCGGPKSVYKPDEDKWLQPAFDKYMSLGSDKPEDCAAQRVFLDQKTKEFLTKFGAQLIDKHHQLEPKPVTDIDSWRVVSSLHSSFASLADCHGR